MAGGALTLYGSFLLWLVNVREGRLLLSGEALSFDYRINGGVSLLLASRGWSHTLVYAIEVLTSDTLSENTPSRLANSS